jgi:hypothetical protein
MQSSARRKCLITGILASLGRFMSTRPSPHRHDIRADAYVFFFVTLNLMLALCNALEGVIQLTSVVAADSSEKK